MASAENTRGARDMPHLMLEAVGLEGVRRIRAARIMVVGVGGLGCAAAQYIAASGVAALTLCDFDTVSESNLARQLLYTEQDVGRPKVQAARDALLRINDHVAVDTQPVRMDPAGLHRLVPDFDVVLDASDNFDTRMMVNHACLEHHVPWVMGACVRMEGQLITFRMDRPDTACYGCVYGHARTLVEDCDGAGVFAPIAGVIGAAMAHQALLLVMGQAVVQHLSVLDGRHWEWRRLAVSRDPACGECGG